MTKKRRQKVPQVLWKLFQNRARTLADTILFLVPPASTTTIQCRCKGRRQCLRCCCDGDRMTFLLRENDPSDYRKLINQCFVVVSDNVPSPPPFDPHCRWSQFEIVRRTIEMISCDQASTNNVICAGYNKLNHWSIVLEALTTTPWNLLLHRVGDALMVHLLRYTSIFVPMHQKKYHQVTGFPVNELCWKLLKHTSESKNQQPSSGVPEGYHEAGYGSKNVDGLESSMGCLGCNVKGTANTCRRLFEKHDSKLSCHGDPINADGSKTTQEKGVLFVARSGKRSRPYAWQRRSKRRKLSPQNVCDANCSLPKVKVIKSIIDADCTDRIQEQGVWPVAKSGKRSRSHAWQRRSKHRKSSSQNMCDANYSLPEEKMQFQCSCCSVWQTLQRISSEVQISKQSILYKLECGTSILPGKHIIYSLKPNGAGANALFKEIFQLSDAGISAQPTVCSHKNDICVIGTTCLYHSLHKLLKILIRKAIHCPRLKILKKHIGIPSMDQSHNEGDERSRFENAPLLDNQDLHCSKRQVASFIWAACRSIVPQELLGSTSNQRILRKNISKFIRLRLYEKFSLHQCMLKLKISNFPFLLDDHSLCDLSNKVQCSSIKHDTNIKNVTSASKDNLLERWICWFFTCLVVPLIQANFYVTEREHGKLEVFFYEKLVWEKLKKSSISFLKENYYSSLDVNAVKKILSCRTFGFSRVRFRPKANGIRPLANLKAPSRLPLRGYAARHFKAVNVVLQDLHVALKDVQMKSPEKLGSSVFSYNDVHRKFREFLSRVKSGSNTLPSVYLVVADVQKAYDSMDQDKLLDVMKGVITDDHLLRQTQQVVVSNRDMQVCRYVNFSRQFKAHVRARSSHGIVVNQGRSRIVKKMDLHFNLQQHVKYNVLLMDNMFYLQNVGIPQGSVLSTLLCSFYLGHMESSKLVPFLNEAAKTGMKDFSDTRYLTETSNESAVQGLLLRLIDDFLYMSTSKKQALACFTRLNRGFREYNCYMNNEKFGLSFDIDKKMPPSKRLYIDEDGNKFLLWSGLFINCKSLEVQADYTRYLDGRHLRSTITVRWEGNPGRYFREKLCDYLRPKCHAIFYDSNINSAPVVRLNIHQAFLLCAMKFHCYVCDLSDIFSFDSGYYMSIIHYSLRFMYKLMKKRIYTLGVEPSLRTTLTVKKIEVEWLGLKAYIKVLKRKQSRYKDLLSLLDFKFKSLNLERISPALKFASDKSNSSVLWKIKY